MNKFIFGGGEHNAVNTSELCYLMGTITFWFQKHNQADKERNAPGRAYPESSTLMVWHRAEEQALQRSCQKGGTTTDEKIKKTKNKKITVIIAIQMSPCFANKY